VVDGQWFIQLYVLKIFAERQSNMKNYVVKYEKLCSCAATLQNKAEKQSDVLYVC